jgi:large subunit ribosomal protein L13
VNTLSYKTKSANKASVEKEWILIDAENQVLGRVASQVAKILRGKHKPTFTPNADTGDKVIIINADKIRLTGNKIETKEYVRHTGHPGGQRFTPVQTMLERHPERVLEKAIRGMLPKNRLGRAVHADNLYVYAGTEHKHQAQNPRQINIKDIK